MVKMTDVARHAGVSIATVSRVLSGANVVSPDTHKRVMDVIAETGYAINQTAQSLSMQSAENIGLLVSEAVYKTRYFPELIRLTTQFAQEHNKKLIITDARADAEDERQGIARLENQQCAVILIMSVSMGSAELGRIIERSTSDIILINKRLRQNPRHAIWVDYQPCTLRLVEMLTRYERDDIAILGDFSPGTPDCEIIEQFRSAARKLKLPRSKYHLVPCARNFQAGRMAMSGLLSGKRSVSAVITCNTEIYDGVSQALSEQHLPVAPLLITFDEIYDPVLEHQDVNVVVINYPELIREALHKAAALFHNAPGNGAKVFRGNLILRTF